MPRTPRTPTYRLHRPSAQAIVTLSGKDIYLGRYGSEASRALYDRLVAEWLQNGRRLPDAASSSDGLVVVELVDAYLAHVQAYYVKGGSPTSEQASIKCALRPLLRFYGETPVAEFGPLKLKSVRQAMIEANWSRGYVNQQVDRIRRMFKWGVENELVEPGVYEGLRAVRGLVRGRSPARETEPVRPVPIAHVIAVEPFVSREIWAMIQIQLLTGCRPGEVVSMRGCDLDVSRSVWSYTPATHKTEHHGKPRTVFLGPKAQAVIRRFLTSTSQAFLFAPTSAEHERNAARRLGRKTPMTPSHRKRHAVSLRRTRSRPPRCRYDVASYRRAIARACDRADAQERASRKLPIDAERIVPRWHPHQLRHNCATALRKELGIEAARVILGHQRLDVTEVYAERDEAFASRVALRHG